MKGIRKRLVQTGPYREVLATIRQELKGRHKEPEVEIRALEQKVKALNKRVDVLLDTVEPEHKGLLNQKLTELGREKQRLEAEIVSLKSDTRAKVDFEKAAREMLGGLPEFEQVFSDDATVNERKDFIRRYLGAIKVDPDKKEALVGWYPIPKPLSPIKYIAGAGFEPATFGL